MGNVKNYGVTRRVDLFEDNEENEYNLFMLSHYSKC